MTTDPDEYSSVPMIVTSRYSGSLFEGKLMPRPGAVVRIDKPHTYLHNAYSRVASAREELDQLLKLSNLADEDKEQFKGLYHQTRKLAENLDAVRNQHSKGIHIQDVEGEGIAEQAAAKDEGILSEKSDPKTEAERHPSAETPTNGDTAA